jgi:hypothetical protein
MSWELKVWVHFAVYSPFYFIGIFIVLIYVIIRLEILASDLKIVAAYLKNKGKGNARVNPAPTWIDRIISPSTLILIIILVIAIIIAFAFF